MGKNITAREVFILDYFEKLDITVSSAPSSGAPSAVQHLQPLCRGDHHQLIRGPVWKMLCLLGMAHCPGPPTGASGLLGQQPPPQA